MADILTVDTVREEIMADIRATASEDTSPGDPQSDGSSTRRQTLPHARSAE